MTISLEEFIKYLLKKWKMMVSVILIVTAIFTGATFFVGNEILVPHSEEYLYYEQEVEYLKSYMEKSILMNLDPTCIYERTLFIKNISDKELLSNYVNSSEIWQDYETERSKAYIWQLISWNENEIGEVELKIKHATSEECMECAEYLKESIQKRDSSAEIIIGAESIFVDEELAKEHLRWYDRIEYAESLLLNSQAGYTITINKTAAAIVGALAGCVAAVMIELVLYIRQEKWMRK